MNIAPEEYLNFANSQPMRDGESIRADFDEDDLWDMCDKCQAKWQCAYWTNKSTCGKNMYEWELQAKKCREKKRILDGFIDVCKNGTSKDCRIYVDDAKRRGITYEELVAYKKKSEGRA